MKKLATIRYHWHGPGPQPTRGCFLMSTNRPRVAYEIVSIERTNTAAVASIVFKIKAARWEPKEVPEGTTIFSIVWDSRRKRRT